MSSGARDWATRLLQTVTVAAVLVGADGLLPARADGLDLSAPQLDPCPLFPGIGDPAYCRAVPPADVVALADIGNWHDFDAFVTMFPTDSLALMPSVPLSEGEVFTDSPGLGLTVSRAEDAAADRLNAAYDIPVPLLDGLQIRSRGALSQAAEDGGGTDLQSNDAHSGLSLVYATGSVTVAVEPVVAINWGDEVSGQTRFGIGNRLSTMLARNLALTLSAGYDSFLFADDPLQNYRALQQRIAMTWGAPDRWQFGLSATSRSEWSIYEERRLVSPGIFVTMPVTRDIGLTARNDFGFSRSSPYDADTMARQDYRNSFGLQAIWAPALMASHAMRVMTGYSLTYDTARAADAALGDGVSLYETQARVAVAMRF